MVKKKYQSHASISTPQKNKEEVAQKKTKPKPETKINARKRKRKRAKPILSPPARIRSNSRSKIFTEAFEWFDAPEGLPQTFYPSVAPHPQRLLVHASSRLETTPTPSPSPMRQ